MWLDIDILVLLSWPRKDVYFDVIFGVIFPLGDSSVPAGSQIPMRKLGIKHIQALARFFKVKAAVFGGE